MKKNFYVLICSLLFLLTSCATSIATTVQRPAELDLNGANSISILPFQTSKGDDGTINILGLIKISFNSNKDDPKKQITEYLTYNLQDSLLNSNYLQVIGSKSVQNAIENGTEIPADCYLSGYLSKWENDIDVETDEDDDGNTTYKFRRHISFDVVYEVIDASTNVIVCSKYKTISETSYACDSKSEVPDSLSLVKSSLDYLIKDIMQQLEPYEVTKYLTLLDDKNNKDAMNAAKAKAKNGMLKEAHEAYNDIYELTNSFEAGYNAAQLLQALGDLDAAEEFMTEVYNKFGEKKAASALNDIRSEKKYAKTLAMQQADKENR